jgi:hypothetical protein
MNVWTVQRMLRTQAAYPRPLRFTVIELSKLPVRSKVKTKEAGDFNWEIPTDILPVPVLMV